MISFHILARCTEDFSGLHRLIGGAWTPLAPAPPIEMMHA